MRTFLKIGLCAVILLRILITVASGQVSAPDPAAIDPSQPDAVAGQEPHLILFVGTPPAPVTYRFDLALRTNLLLDVIGGPNIGIEVPIGTQYSIAADFAYAHTRINNRYALQTTQGSLEGRYWFAPRGERLTGWSLGVYGTYGGRFDIQWGGGRQGDRYWSLGAVGGYAIPVWDYFHLDFAIAAGYLFSPEVRRYDRPRDGHLVWNRTMYNISRIAITQVRVNLVWPILKR